MTDGMSTTLTDATSTRRLGRRAVLGGAAAAAAAGFVTHVDAAATAAQEDPATFVLVHGSWAGAWIWRDVIARLRAAGHNVYATTATGMGDRVHLADPAIDLDVYITDVVNVLAYEDLSDVTLVGWSFGGMIITGVAEQVPERLARLVYLDGVVPEDGQSGYDFWGYTEEGIGAEYRAGAEAGMPGFEVVPPGAEEWIRASLADPAVADWMLSKLAPQPLATSSQPIELANPEAAALPRVFVLCTADKDLEMDPQTDPYVLTVERVRSDPNWHVVELADNHLAPVNNPQATAEALLSLV